VPPSMFNWAPSRRRILKREKKRQVRRLIRATRNGVQWEATEKIGGKEERRRLRGGHVGGRDGRREGGREGEREGGRNVLPVPIPLHICHPNIEFRLLLGR